jgi:hypothetical protein
MSTQQFQGKLEFLDDVELKGITTAEGKVHMTTGNKGNAAGAGITGGTGTICETSVVRRGSEIETTILLDLTGLTSKNTLADIIGHDAATDLPAFITQITSAVNGTIKGGTIVCLEAPAGGEVDIDIFSAAEATGVYDGLATDLTETAVMTAGADFTIGLTKFFTGDITDNHYLYLAVGTNSTPTAGTYTAGRFLIRLHGIA